MSNKIFLGGTCNETTWRGKVCRMIQGSGLEYFDPVVDDWTPECQAREEYAKLNECNIHLYVITSAMTGVYSIAEAMESAYCMGILTVFQVVPEGFADSQLKSLEQVSRLINEAGGYAFIHDSVGRAVALIGTLMDSDIHVSSYDLEPVKGIIRRTHEISIGMVKERGAP